MHPFFDISTLKSQLRWSEISGVDRIHYCGAYWKWGFHEDGLWSAMRVVDQLMLKDKVEQKSA
jgi:predicted NAD/FAD-binding protein